MSPIRERAKQIISAIPDRSIRSDQSDYQKYTGGLKQETLQANWNKRGIMTGCNAFVGWYGAALGSGSNLGRFDLVTFLPSIGKGHAWIKSALGRRPQFGDILLHTGLHEDVALDFDGDILNRIAAGQGGPAMGCDILCRVRGKAAYNPVNLQGWIDIDQYFGAAPAVGTTSVWLNGWWKVCDGNTYYYHFEAGGNVQYTKTRPASAAAPSKYPMNCGVFTIAPTGTMVIDWNPADGGATRETFSNARPGSTQMNGTSNRYAPLVATRL